MKNQIKKDYARVVYNKDEIPLTKYPKKLVKYLINKYDLQANQSLLELGPARGDFLKEWSNENFKIFAVDISDYGEYCPNVNFMNSKFKKIKFSLLTINSILYIQSLSLSIYIQKKF